MEALFEGLTESEIRYLLYLNEHGYYDGFEMFLNEDTSSDYRVDKLYKNGYITLDESGPYPGSQSVTLTGKGVAAIIDYERHQEQKQSLASKDNALNRIANSLDMLTSASIRQSDSVESIVQSTKEQANAAIQQAISTQAIAESSITQTKTATEQAKSTKAIADASKKQADSVQIIAQEETKQANLTLNAKIALYKLYKEYLDRRKHGFTQPFSKSFGSFEEIKKNFFSKTPSEDLNDSLHELTENGFLYDIPINDVTHKYELSNHAIATLEAIPKEAILSLAKFIPNLFL